MLAATLATHGGDLRVRGGAIAAAVTGEWSPLITRIQPLVTDHRWRIDAQERLLPVAFDERVRAPISLHAHPGHTVGLDLDRGLTASDVTGAKWSEMAARRATAVK